MTIAVRDSYTDSANVTLELELHIVLNSEQLIIPIVVSAFII